MKKYWIIFSAIALICTSCSETKESNQNEPRVTEETEDEVSEVDQPIASVEEVATEELSNLETGALFIIENSKKEGVITTSSGLQYAILEPGSGEKPLLTDVVTIHYHGTLLDSTVFDSSIDKGEPLSYAVNGFIQGWQEALVMMSIGSKWRLFVPSHLAYGQVGTPGGPIGPDETLIFDIELLSIN